MVTTGSGSALDKRQTHTSRILVLDEDPATSRAVHAAVAPRGGYEVVSIRSTDEALSAYASCAPVAVVLDLSTTGTLDGLSVLSGFRSLDRDVPVLVLSPHRLDAVVMQAMKLGAAAYASKPLHGSDLQARLLEILDGRAEPGVADGSLSRGELTNPMISSSGQLMADVAALIQRVADTDVTVLIRGETGTGKEVVARALVNASRRRDKPFVKVNCAAIPNELLESELFGFERGAFTSAVQHKPGKFEFANHGTIFLDEIGEIAFPMQAKLLHVLQDGEFSRLGGNRDVHVDVRMIAATNRDLEAAVADGSFRADLFYRLNVIAITLPPLRDRPDDVLLLTTHFLKKYAAQYNRPPASLSPEAHRLFLEYNWPGNVRELENAVKYAVIVGTDAPLIKELSASIATGLRRGMTVAPPPVTSPLRESRTPSTVQTAGPQQEERAALRAVSPLRAVPAPVAPPPATSAEGPAEGPPEPDTYSLKQVARDAARNAERELILQVLQRTRWNRKAAAALLSISYKALLYKIKENGLDLVTGV